MIETRVIGTSVEGRDITAYRMGTPGGRVVLVIGVIHGDENKGRWSPSCYGRCRHRPTSICGSSTASIRTGVANGTRQNANAVDLNRNFEEGWSYIAKGNHMVNIRAKRRQISQKPRPCKHSYHDSNQP